MKKRKIKDIPKDTSLYGWKIKEGYIISGWNKGFWVTDDFKAYQTNKRSKVTPVFFNSYEDIKDWEIEPR